LNASQNASSTPGAEGHGYGCSLHRGQTGKFISPDLGPAECVQLLMTDPSAPVPSAQKLSTVPPVLSAAQMVGAVSIELKGTYHADYVALGVIDIRSSYGD
jgi:hypothetical protein